jgi:hypothetical protein
MSPISPICERGLILLPSEKLRHPKRVLADTPIRPYAVTLYTPSRPRLQGMPLESIIGQYARKFGSGGKVFDR